MVAKGSPAWAGWILFAGAILLVTGLVNVIQGIIALADDKRLAWTPNNLVIVDVTGWGWTLLIAGLLMLAAGTGLLLAQTWARITAIVIVAVHIVIQVAWLGAYPVWSLLMIGLDIVVLFALTARWGEAREDLERSGDIEADAPQASSTS